MFTEGVLGRKTIEYMNNMTVGNFALVNRTTWGSVRNYFNAILQRSEFHEECTLLLKVSTIVMSYISDDVNECDAAHIAPLIGSKVNQLVIIKLLPPSAQEDILRARYHQSNIYGSLALAGMVSLLEMDSRRRVLSKGSFYSDKRECLRLCDLSLEGLLRECANVSRYWCDERPHGQIYRESLLGLAIQSSPPDINIIRMLLTSGPISDEARGERICIAASQGYTNIVKMLLASGSISNKSRGALICEAAAKGQSEIIRMLLASGSIIRIARGRGVCSAALRGYLDIVEMLLARGPILDRHREEGICAAASKGYTNIVEILLASGSISEETRGGGVCSAASRSYLDIVEMLLASGSISDKDRKQAIHIATENNHPDIVIMLKKTACCVVS
jgi:hypothetical protein